MAEHALPAEAQQEQHHPEHQDRWPRQGDNVCSCSCDGLTAFLFEDTILHFGAFGALAAAIGLILAIIAVSIRVAHHAEVLAARVGDPYGTMILTLSAVVVEVIILVILMTGSASVTLARDTIFSAVMLDINGILGLSALLGGWKFGEQEYNDDPGKTYGAMILTAMGIS